MLSSQLILYAPVCFLQGELYVVFVCLGLLNDLIAFYQRFFDLAVFIQLEQGVVHQVQDIYSVCVVVSTCRIEIIDFVGQVHRDVSTGIGVLFLCAAE